MNCQRCGYSSGIDFAVSCPLCGNLLAASTVRSVTKEQNREDEIPWEKQLNSSYPLNGLIETLQQSFFRTDQLFKSLKNIQNSKKAILFALITGSFGLTASFVWSYVLKGSTSGIEPAQQSYFSYILSPLFILLQVLISTVYVHFMLFIIRTKKASIHATLRLICYSEGAMILNALPYIGSFLSMITWLYFIITGIHQVHETSKWRAFFALLLPFIALLAVSFLLIFLAITAGILAGANNASMLQKFLGH